ncbi:hypothetical protein [Catellatospora tritici]|uniref:hypothetical protein n=1 Tax=Catellatospora tritici TaxID=2851566 RepID=UPI001C2DA00B|nr:hypothetical protein [Catellatospora tritici]MBV1853020.1 hypothetical protein [Catellatospora tritici]
MPLTPRLLGQVRLDRPAAPSQVQVLRHPRRLVTVRHEQSLTVYDLDTPQLPLAEPVASFPAPWPVLGRGDAVSPGLDLAVFAGPHALRAVDRDGVTRWELKHGCWSDQCWDLHEDYDEYRHEPGHRYLNHGSARFSADGSIVWAHVRSTDPDDDGNEAWLVVAPDSGRILAQTVLETCAERSYHVGHPDPGQMGLCLDEGQDGAPLWWGRWDGHTLEVASYGADTRCLFDVDPSGTRLFTVAHGQYDLAVLDGADGRTAWTLSSETLAAEGTEIAFEYGGGFVDERTLLVRSVDDVECDWLIEPAADGSAVEVAYPDRIPDNPIPLGDGTWLTHDGDLLRRWARG